jgi:hypothetical protein
MEGLLLADIIDLLADHMSLHCALREGVETSPDFDVIS